MPAPDAEWEASRRLLRRVRDMMAAQGSARARLDQVVRIIANEMVAEVCSVYVRRGDKLVLTATQGLKREAVHVTRLAIGEGLIGLIAEQARPIALPDAQAHPNFAYRPETGEDDYHALLGVPMLRGGRVVGVLAVQNRTQRNYTEDESETLQTVAMVLAEVASSDGAYIEPGGVRSIPAPAAGPVRLAGDSLNKGLAVGFAVIAEVRLPIDEIVAEDTAAERLRLQAALGAMHSSLDAMFSSADLAKSGEHRDVLETYRMFAQDRGWLDRIEEALQGGLTAEAAVRRVQDDMRARFRQARDAYLRERLHDLDDLSNRLLQHLLGEDADGGLPLPNDAIVVARAMGPAQLLDYDRSKLKAVVLEEGSLTAHVTIVAKALDIPIVGNVDDALGRVETGDPLIVDGNNGVVYVRPTAEARASFAESIKVQAERQAGYAAMRDLPAVTRDGVRIVLKLNGGFLIDAQQIAPRGAEGIGLYRTELPFMVRHDFPDVEAQAELYGRVLDAADGKPVTFRTLDVGGDKLLPYWRPGRDENPALGWRAIRLSLDRPALMRTQLRALLRAAAGRDLEIMFPMVAEVAEFDRARAMLDAERKREIRRGTPPPARVAVGVMLEVPALIWQLPALLARVDFVSVGSNDLLQFLFAADRGNPRLAGRYDSLAPAVLACLADIADQCAASGKPFAFCGDMAGNPLEAMALIALGYRAISMPAPAIGPIKAMVRSLELEPLANYVRSLATAPDHSLREKLRSYATDRGVLI